MRERLLGAKHRVRQLISDRDREVAIHELDGFYERGFIDEIEHERRVEHVKLASSAHDIEPLLADLREGRRGRRDVRVPDDDRAAARRRVDLHLQAGQLNATEHERRAVLIDRACTPAEIADALRELPALKPHKQPRGERLASDAEREDACRRLSRALADGRLTIDEHGRRYEVAHNARTRDEIEAAFYGLDPEHLQKPLSAAAKVGADVVRGGKIVLAGLIVFAWVAVSALVVLVWLVTGMGPALPIVVLIVLALIAGVLLYVPRMLHGRRRQH